MPNSLHKLHIQDAVGKKNKFNRSRSHLTTLDISQISVLMHEDLVPGDQYTVNTNIFARLAPLAVPTYGSFFFKTATMFIPYYQVFQGAEAFFAGKDVSRGQSVLIPTITKLQLHRILTNTDCSSTSSDTSYDFCYTSNTSLSPTFKKFNSFGRWVYKILRSLGYQIPNFVSTTGSISGASNANDKLNALPLICFFKAYNDYMSQSQRFDTSILTSYLESIRLKQNVDNFFNSSTCSLIGDGVVTLFKNIYLQYEDDYFTTCWNSPNNPINSMQGDTLAFDFHDTGISPDENRSIENSVDKVSTTLPSSNILTARTLTALRDFDNWVRRNNYSGSREVEKILSRFGIHPEDYRSQYCHLINTSSSVVSVGDVTSLSDTSSSDGGLVLGDYAGKGIVSDTTKYQFTASDFGFLVTLAWITVKPMYADGYDRFVLKTSPLDFFQPEFDGLGGNPVSRGELFVDRKNSDHSEVRDSQVFGFNERYNEYKSGNLDQITGDFTIYDDMSSWHFNRQDLKSLDNDNKLIAQNSAFNTLNNSSANQYNRIFNSETGADSAADHFYITAQFDVQAYRPMKSLNEVPNLGVGNINVDRNGTVIH